MKEFLKEGTKYSMARFNMLILTVTAVAISVVSSIKGSVDMSIVGLVGVLIGTGTAGKALQKKNEK